MTQTYRIALVPGDGIGPEIVPVALDVLNAACDAGGVSFECESFPWGAGYYQKHGRFMDDGALEAMKAFDAILFGAVGLPDVDDRLPARDFTFRVRCGLGQYVNYRPVRSFPGVTSPLTKQPKLDFVVIRENTEGEFVQVGSVRDGDQPEGFAVDTSIFTRKGITRVARYAFQLAQRRRGKVTTVTKSNTLIHSLAYWDRVIGETAAEFPDVEHGYMYVDNASANFVLRPEQFDVVLTTNMIGDILSDLGGALMGSLGLGGAGNLNPERTCPSMFEPIHGSAPDIAGKQIANPVGTIWSGAMMLEQLGHADIAGRIMDAVDATLADGVKTVDVGGDAKTGQFAGAVIQRLT